MAKKIVDQIARDLLFIVGLALLAGAAVGLTLVLSFIAVVAYA